MLNASLIVDSSFVSRRELVSDLQSSGLCPDIHEAASLNDALLRLSSSPLDACLVGPSVTEQKAAEFLDTAIKISKQKNCAFIGVLKPHQTHAEVLIQAGAHATLSKPYSITQFSETVQKAVTQAISQKVAASGNQIDISLLFCLQELTESLASIANSKELSPLDYKFVCPVRKELKKAFANSLYRNDIQPDLQSERFITAISEWFIDYSSNGHTFATENLRHRLLATVLNFDGK